MTMTFLKKDPYALENAEEDRSSVTDDVSVNHRSSTINPCQHSNDWNHIMSNCITRHYSEHETIFHEGSPSDFMYILMQGTVKVWAQGRSGTNHIFRILSTTGSQDHVLDAPSFFRSTYSVTADPMTPCHLTIINKAQCRPLLHKDPEVSWRILNLVATETDYYRTRLHLERECSARERVAFSLLDLQHAEELSRTDKNRTVVTLERKELVDLIGISRETVARILSDFSRRKWIQIRKRQIIILDSESLLKLSPLSTLPEK